MAKPTARHKEGNIELTEWEQTSKNGSFKTFTLQRAYTTDDGATWKYSDNITASDLPKLLKCVEKAIAANPVKKK